MSCPDAMILKIAAGGGSVPNLGISILEEIEHKIKVFQDNKLND
jgi:hypothetical protein